MTLNQLNMLQAAAAKLSAASDDLFCMDRDRLRVCVCGGYAEKIGEQIKHFDGCPQTEVKHLIDSLAKRMRAAETAMLHVSTNRF